MTLREIADTIRREGGELSRFFGPPRADGSRVCALGGEITAGQYSALERMLRPVLSAEERKRNALRAHASRYDPI